MKDISIHRSYISRKYKKCNPEATRERAERGQLEGTIEEIINLNTEGNLHVVTQISNSLICSYCIWS